MAKFQALKGFRDFYPDEFAQRQHIFSAWREVAHKHGFEEYDAPPLESLELYKKKSGEEIVGQLYAFDDKGGRQVAMRPEMTPSVARMVAARWQSLPKPVKWFSIPQLFRYERPQAGRLREHFQFNADIFGDASPLADAQLLALTIDIFKALGLGPSDVELRVSDRRVLNSVLTNIGITDSDFASVYRVLDKFDRYELSDSIAALVSSGLSSAQIDAILAAIVRSRELTSSRGQFGSALADSHATPGFNAIGYYLSPLVTDYREWVTFDLTIVRGLAYYTGTVFEAFDRKGAFRAICGGGRYDDLLQSIGGVDGAAVGVGCGDVVLTELLLQRTHDFLKRRRVDWLVTAGIDGDASDTVRRLRELGFRADSAQNKRQGFGKSDMAQAKFLFVLDPDNRPQLFDSERGGRWSFSSPSAFIDLLEKEVRITGAMVTDDWIREKATAWSFSGL